MASNFTPINFTFINVEKVRKRAERHEMIVSLFLLLVVLTLAALAIVLGFMIKQKLNL